MLFSISDRMEKTVPKYELMKHEQAEDLQPPVTIRKFGGNAILYTAFLIGFLLVMQVMWYHRGVIMTCNSISKATEQVTEDIDLTLDALRDYAALIPIKNKQIASKYLNYIEDVLHNLTTHWIRRMSEIFSETNTEIELELNSYENMMEKEYQDIADHIRANLTSIQKSISSSSQPTDDLKKLLQQTNDSIATMLTTVDDLYAFGVASLMNITTQKVQKVIDRITRAFLCSRTSSYQCIASEQIDFCYNISEQNGKTEKLLRTLIRTMQIIESTIETVNTTEAVLEKQLNSNLLADSDVELRKALIDSRRLLESTLTNDSYFLGSLVRAISEQRRHKVNDFIMKSYHTSIANFGTTLKRTTSDFRVIKKNNFLQTNIETLLNSLAKATQSLTNKKNARGKTDAISSRDLEDLQQSVQKKFENMTSVYNDAFNTYKLDLFNYLPVKVESIVIRSKIYTSSLSIRNYLLSDVCPFAADYQSFKTTELGVGKQQRQELPFDIRSLISFFDFANDDIEGALENGIQTDEVQITVFYADPDDNAASFDKNLDAAQLVDLGSSINRVGDRKSQRMGRNGGSRSGNYVDDTEKKNENGHHETKERDDDEFEEKSERRKLIQQNNEEWHKSGKEEDERNEHRGPAKKNDEEPHRSVKVEDNGDRNEQRGPVKKPEERHESEKEEDNERKEYRWPVKRNKEHYGSVEENEDKRNEPQGLVKKKNEEHRSAKEEAEKNEHRELGKKNNDELHRAMNEEDNGERNEHGRPVKKNEEHRGSRKEEDEENEYWRSVKKNKEEHYSSVDENEDKRSKSQGLAKKKNEHGSAKEEDVNERSKNRELMEKNNRNESVREKDDDERNERRGPAKKNTNEQGSSKEKSDNKEMKTSKNDQLRGKSEAHESVVRNREEKPKEDEFEKETRKSDKKSRNGEPEDRRVEKNEKTSEPKSGYLQSLSKAMKPVKDIISTAEEWVEKMVEWIAVTTGEQWERELKIRGYLKNETEN